MNSYYEQSSTNIKITADISVIIPIGPNPIWLARSLKAALNSNSKLREVILVVDGFEFEPECLDNLYKNPLVKIEKLVKPQGPAKARNHGAKIASGNIFVFIDSDVEIKIDTISLMISRMSKLNTDGVYGSYTARSIHDNFTSRYKQLLNHFTHQTSAGKSSSFWGACSAITREAFENCGGFDDIYRTIEDIVLGSKLNQKGYTIYLLPEVAVDHLKKWTLSKMIKSDIFDRAIPWSKLIFSKNYLPNELNLQWKFRISALIAVALIPALLLTTESLLVTPLLLAIFIFLNLDFYKTCFEHFGTLFTIKSCAMHILYYIYSLICLGSVFIKTLYQRLSFSLRKSIKLKFSNLN